MTGRVQWHRGPDGDGTSRCGRFRILPSTSGFTIVETHGPWGFWTTLVRGVETWEGACEVVEAFDRHLDKCRVAYRRRGTDVP